MLLFVRCETKPKGMAGIGAPARPELAISPMQHVAGCASTYRTADVRNFGTTVRPSGLSGGRTG